MMSENSSPPSSASGAAASIGAIAAAGGMIGSISDTIKKSGGSEVAGYVSNALPTSTKEYLSEAKEKMFNRDQLRSPGVFFGFGEEKPFYVERTPSLVVERLQHNISFFYMNYLLLAAILFALTLLTSPLALIAMAILAAAWVAVIKMTQNDSCTLGGVGITQKQVSLVMTVGSGLLLFYILKNVFWWALGSTGVLVAVHSFLRDASMHKDEEDKIQMTGDIGVAGPEDAAFLTPAPEDSVV